MTGVAVVFALTVVGIPFAALYLLRRSLSPQALVIERGDAKAALLRSNELVEGHTGRTFAIAAVVNGAAAVMPFAGLVLALLSYDLRLRRSDTPVEAQGS